MVMGIPDSGLAHGIGYANRKGEMAHERVLDLSYKSELSLVDHFMENLEHFAELERTKSGDVRSLLVQHVQEKHSQLREKAGKPPQYGRGAVKYTPSFQRSYTHPEQRIRDKVAKMKLIPIGAALTEGWNELTKTGVRGKIIVVNEDSHVRGTQLKNSQQEKRMSWLQEEQ
jgi:glutamine phosphoribosylpyrophosphate amidotransferase